MAAMADGITSTDDLCMFWADCLIVLAMNLCQMLNRNNDDVGELSDRARGKTETDSSILWSQQIRAVVLELVTQYQCLYYFITITILL